MNSEKNKVEIKLLCTVLIASILMQLVMPLISFADNSLSVELSSTATELKAGETINVDIYVKGDGKISYFEAYVDYDTSIFEKISKGSIYINSNLTADEDYGLWSKTFDEEAGNKISISESNGDSYNIPDDGYLGSLKLKVKTDADSSEITFNNTALVQLINKKNKDIEIGTLSVNVPAGAESKYTITYNPNTSDAVSNMPTSFIKTSGEDCLIANAPSRAGYTFTGWNTEADGNGTSYIAGDVYSTDADLQLYAQWQIITTALTVNPNGGVWEGSSGTQTFTQEYGTTKTISDPTTTPSGYIVRFSGNGGTPSSIQETQTTTFANWNFVGGGVLNGTTYTFSDIAGTLTANYTGNTITLPDATKTGATLKGWYTAQTEGTKVGGAGDSYMPTEATTLFAQWEDIDYTLTVNPNGGEWNGSTANGTVQGIYNSTTTIADPTEPNGYTVTFDNEGTITTETQTKTFTGWTVVSGAGTISGSNYTFGAEDGEIEASYTENSINLPQQTKTGYTFEGWYTQSTGGTKVGDAGDSYTPTGDITLYAQYTANTYEITLDSNNGSASTTKTVTYGQPYGTLPTPTKAGYDFDGWYDPDGNKITEIDIVDVTSDTTLTAQWLGAEYTVTLDPDGGTVSQTTIKVRNEGKYGTLPDATKVGYTFKGWYNESGNKIESTTTVNLTTDETLTAQWEAIKTTLTVDPQGGAWEGDTVQQTFTQDYNTTKDIEDPTAPNGYVVSFDCNGGDSNPSALTQPVTFDNWTLTGGTIFVGPTYTFDITDETLTANYTREDITLPDVTKIGATFKGWYTEATEGTKIGEVGDNYTPTTDVTLYAQWEDINYTLTVDPDGGEWNGNTGKGTVQGTYSSTTIIAEPTAPNGYTVTFDNEGTTSTEIQTKTFAEWTVVSGTGTISGNDYTFGAEDGEIIALYTENSINLPQQTKTGYTFEGWYTQSTGGTKVGDAGDSYTPTGDITLYAQYTANTYEITFNPTSGTVNTTSMTVTYGQPYGTLPTPTRDGYDFDGWYDQNGNKITENDIVDVTSDTTLTAQWLGAEYTVTLDPDGGTVSQTTIKVRNEGKYGTLPDATKVGYTFKGWYNESGNKIESTTTVNLTTDETLTAQWEAIKTTLTVDPQGGTWEGDTVQQTFTQDYNTTKDIEDPTAPNGYVVSFDCNGGDSNPSALTQPVTFDNWALTGGTIFVGPTYTFDITDETLTANYTREDITLPDVTKIGATFKGWYTEATEGTKVGEVGDNYTPTTDVTLYAQWEDINYTLTVDPDGGEWNGNTGKGTVQGTYSSTTTIAEPTAPNGYTVTLDDEGTITTKIQTKTFTGWTVVTGTGTISGNDYTFGAEDGEITASYTENSVNLPQPTKTGYTFEGWYTEATGGTQIDPTYTPTEDITLYAQYTANTYEITFDPTDGTVDTPSITVTYEEPYGTLPLPTKDGYDFDGWYDQNGNKITENDIVDVTSDTTLTAQWLGSEYTVTFDYVDGTGSVPSKNVRNDETYGELPQGTKEGYTFVEWQDENGNKIESTTIVNLRSDITLSAVYEINKYTVTFQNDDGTVIDTVIVEHGEKVEYTGTTPVQNNIPAGYESTFYGWENADKLDNITEDTTIKAKYTLTPIEYTITYNNLNGDENLNNPTTYTIEDGTIQLVDLPDQGKLVFKGWYTTNDENGTKVISIDTSKLENIILYAKWEEEKLYLKSQKYKVGENDIDIYEENDIYLDKIEPETTVAELINNCETNGTITVIDAQGNILGEDDLVGTNMTIKVTRYDEEITLTAVVMGDLDGNGKVTATDLSTLNQTVLKLIQIDGAVFKAADLDDNEKITATDLSTENNAILKNITLTYTKPNKTER